MRWPWLSASPPFNRLTWWRRVLLAPHVFDIVSWFLQWRQQARFSLIDVGDTEKGAAYLYNTNVTLTKRYVKTRRAERLYQLAVFDHQPQKETRLLIIGPRTVQELYLAWLYGFCWSRITAIDLYSLHPKIQIMDMEHITFPDNTFDVLVSSNTLTYATNLRACLHEVVRVLGHAGYAVFETVYNPEDTTWLSHSVSSRIITEWLEELPVTVHYQHSTDKTDSKRRWQRTTTWVISKR